MLQNKLSAEATFQKCFPNCTEWWIISVDGRVVTTCKESWGAGSCRDSPANKRRKKRK